MSETTPSAPAHLEGSESAEPAECISIAHRRAGDLRVAKRDVLCFDGIPGFPEARRWALVAHDVPSVFSWLVSLDDPNLALPVVDARALFSGYAPKLSRSVLDAVGAGDAEEVVVLAIANLRHQPAVVNLSAPLLVHAGTRRGVQAILEEELPVAAPVPDGAPSPGDAAQIESKPQR
ncbi:MAG: flagellar assembly protein FliW [Myxococcota bacterium]